MQHIIKRVWNDELGSAAVDWAVLGAGVTSLALAVTTTLF